MNCDTERFHESTFLEGDGFGELVAEIFGEDVVFGESSVVRRCSGKLHVLAKVVFAALAGFAASAGDAGFHCDSVADGEGCDGGTDFGDYTGGFVAEDHWVFDDEATNCAVFPVVDLRVLAGAVQRSWHDV